MSTPAVSFWRFHPFSRCKIFIIFSFHRWAESETCANTTHGLSLGSSPSVFWIISCVISPLKGVAEIKASIAPPPREEVWTSLKTSPQWLHFVYPRSAQHQVEISRPQPRMLWLIWGDSWKAKIYEAWRREKIKYLSRWPARNKAPYLVESEKGTWTSLRTTGIKSIFCRKHNGQAEHRNQRWGQSPREQPGSRPHVERCGPGQ